MSDNLKPCPFCGSKVEIDASEMFTCDDCGMIMRFPGSPRQRENAKHGLAINNYDTEWHVSRWNTRAEPAYLAGYKDGLAVGKCEERTCRGCAENDNRENSDECAWCNRNPMYEDNFDLNVVD